MRNRRPILHWFLAIVGLLAGDIESVMNYRALEIKIFPVESTYSR